jgi:hypothetical protein
MVPRPREACALDVLEIPNVTVTAVEPLDDRLNPLAELDAETDVTPPLVALSVPPAIDSPVPIAISSAAPDPPEDRPSNRLLAIVSAAAVYAPDSSEPGTVALAVITPTPVPFTYPVSVVAPVPPFAAPSVPVKVTAPAVPVLGRRPVVPPLKVVTPPAEPVALIVIAPLPLTILMFEPGVRVVAVRPPALFPIRRLPGEYDICPVPPFGTVTGTSRSIMVPSTMEMPIPPITGELSAKKTPPVTAAASNQIKVLAPWTAVLVSG